MVYNSPSSTFTIPSYGYNYSSGSETIDDDGNPLIHSNKPCLHIINRFIESPLPVIQTGYGAIPGSNISSGYDPGDPLYKSNDCVVGACRFNDPASLAVDYPGSDNFPTLSDVPNDIQARMFERLMPKVNDGLSLVNFVLELKDLRRMFDWKTVESLFGRYVTIRGKEYWQKPKLKKRIKDASDDYLNYSFGWKPLVGDLEKMVKTLRGLGKRLAYLKNHSGKELVRQGSYTLEVPSFPDSIDVGSASYASCAQVFSYYNTESSSIHGVHSQFYEYLPRYHASVKFIYRLPYSWDGVMVRIRGFLDALGVRLDPSIIWNAIPFSFVVDWIISVGDWLRQLSPTDLGMEIVVIDASHSVKWSFARVTTGVFEVHSSHPSYPDPLEVELGVQERAYYERAIWNPSKFASNVTMPTGTQLSLAGALGISRKSSKPWR